MVNNKFSPKNVVQVYQAFAEACKYGFAWRVNLGDMKDNPITNATERVMTFECVIASNYLNESLYSTVYQQLDVRTVDSRRDGKIVNG